MGEYVVADLFYRTAPGFLSKPRGGARLQYLQTSLPGNIQSLNQPVGRKSGMVAIIGLPNAGKSSLLNALVGTKLSIVTSAAQTTRQQVVGIDTRDDTQLIFLDTPGIVDPAYLLHHSMLGIVAQTLRDADVVVLLLDGTQSPPEFDEEITALLERVATPLIPAINKADRAGQQRIDALIEWSGQRFDRPPAVLSVTEDRGIEELRERIVEALPEHPFFYPDEDISTQSVRFFAAELIRESIFESYRDEVPYSTHVVINEFRENDDPIFIRATVYVERASQKGILIGQRGAAIRALGISAREKIEAFTQARVYLDLWVKVLPKWRKKAEELKRFGFPVPEEKN